MIDRRLDTDGNVLVSVPEASRRLGIGRRQIERAIRKGDLASFQIGSWPRLRWLEVLDWLDRQRRPAGVSRPPPSLEGSG